MAELQGVGVSSGVVVGPVARMGGEVPVPPEGPGRDPAAEARAAARRWRRSPRTWRHGARPAKVACATTWAMKEGNEDIAGTSWWAGALATLASQSGNAYLRFVGRVDGHRRYKGATFPAPRTLGALPSKEAWAPGMTKSLQDLRRDIENDGWVEIGLGTEPWAFRYERFVRGSPET
jgi:hypothetical protein